jgi:hypothetical protein
MSNNIENDASWQQYFKEYFNPIEKKALEQEYFKNNIPAYPFLHRLLHDKNAEAMQDGEIAYWQALHHLMYMVFENLRFLWLRLNEKPGTGHNVYEHLPTFMSTFMMGFPIAEYLKKMICILSIENSFLDKKRFTNIISGREWKKEFCEVIRFLGAASKYQGCAKINEEWDNFAKANRIRHMYTHAFRVPWWPRNDTQIYGFPYGLFSNQRKMMEEIWEFVKDAQSWERKVSSLPYKDFKSGADLIRELHRDGTKMANTLFLSFIEHINPRTTKA